MTLPFAPMPDPDWIARFRELLQRVSTRSPAQQLKFQTNRLPTIRGRIAQKQGPKLPPMPIPQDMPMPSPIPPVRVSNPRDPNRY